MKLKYSIIGVVAILISIGGYFLGAEMAHEKFEEIYVPTEVTATKSEIDVEDMDTVSDLYTDSDIEVDEEEFEGTSTNKVLDVDDGEVMDLPSDESDLLEATSAIEVDTEAVIRLDEDLQTM
ncbi:hypothetical protein H6784_02465 [Candidatus Nomurabacteria bacterium]|nr:hypothetical protein [Candidatus Kaiserbacteria bacterium]MCB9814260.1 hypothetical protein [Candidatus Nomurabacteria bacterium]